MQTSLVDNFQRGDDTKTIKKKMKNLCELIKLYCNKYCTYFVCITSCFARLNHANVEKKK